MQKAAQAYLQTNLNTDSPGGTLLALYNGALTFLAQAKEHMEAKDYARKGILISKTMDILNELSSALNRERGGEISEKLHNLYFWCNTQLAVANIKLDTSIVDNVIKVLSGLRDAFEHIQNSPEAQVASRQISVRQAESSQQARFCPQTPLPANPGANLRGRSLYGKVSLNRSAAE
jgi:flagellar protein FliS